MMEPVFRQDTFMGEKEAFSESSSVSTRSKITHSTSVEVVLHKKPQEKNLPRTFSQIHFHKKFPSENERVLYELQLVVKRILMEAKKTYSAEELWNANNIDHKIKEQVREYLKKGFHWESNQEHVKEWVIEQLGTKSILLTPIVARLTGIREKLNEQSADRSDVFFNLLTNSINRLLEKKENLDGFVLKLNEVVKIKSIKRELEGIIGGEKVIDSFINWKKKLGSYFDESFKNGLDQSMKEEFKEFFKARIQKHLKTYHPFNAIENAMSNRLDDKFKLSSTEIDHTKPKVLKEDMILSILEMPLENFMIKGYQDCLQFVKQAIADYERMFGIHLPWFDQISHQIELMSNLETIKDRIEVLKKIDPHIQSLLILANGDSAYLKNLENWSPKPCASQFVDRYLKLRSHQNQKDKMLFSSKEFRRKKRDEFSIEKIDSQELIKYLQNNKGHLFKELIIRGHEKEFFISQTPKEAKDSFQIEDFLYVFISALKECGPKLLTEEQWEKQVNQLIGTAKVEESKDVKPKLVHLLNSLTISALRRTTLNEKDKHFYSLFYEFPYSCSSVSKEEKCHVQIDDNCVHITRYLQDVIYFNEDYLSIKEKTNLKREEEIDYKVEGKGYIVAWINKVYQLTSSLELTSWEIELQISDWSFPKHVPYRCKEEIIDELNNKLKK